MFRTPTTIESSANRHSALRTRWLLGAAVLLLWPATSWAAGESDIALFSSAAGAPPNIMLLLDDSGSMDDEPSWCDTGFGSGGWGGWDPAAVSAKKPSMRTRSLTNSIFMFTHSLSLFLSHSYSSAAAAAASSGAEASFLFSADL